jgi:DNA polymerase III epsilon subunit-like protein
MSLLFLDTETTGFTHSRLVQIAWEEHPTGERYVQCFQPPVPIEQGAIMVHKRTNSMAGTWPRFANSFAEIHLHKLIQKNIVVCHNAAYDLKVLKNERVLVPKHICTLKIARELLPDQPDHKLQGLYERIGFPVAEKDPEAHDALGDVLVMIGLFAHLWKIERQTLPAEEIIPRWVHLSQSAPEKMPWGKYKGTPMRELPKAYVRWLFAQKDMDESIIRALMQLADTPTIRGDNITTSIDLQLETDTVAQKIG